LINNKILKFADDTKLVGIVSNESEVNQLRADLKHLYDWSVDWQMLFNTEKCKVMHFGHRNVAGTYSLGDNFITDCNQEKDLGVIVSSTLKSSSQCVAAANSANRTLGMIKRTFINRDRNTLLRLYQSLVRPKLEYCVQAWRPYLKKDVDLLENVQRRATRLMFKDRGFSYGERLRILGLTTLETRRLRGDLIEVFKIFKGFVNVKYTDFFTLSNTGLRGHNFKLYKPQVRLDIRKYFFSVRVIDEWNSLPVAIINCNTIHTFKKKIDYYFKNRGYI